MELTLTNALYKAVQVQMVQQLLNQWAARTINFVDMLGVMLLALLSISANRTYPMVKHVTIVSSV
jgi:hypothetical protein